MTLDFVVMGVPRSGTTAAAHALNLHTEIMCGIEYFPDAPSACTSALPQAFEDCQFAHSPICDVTRHTYQRKKSSARIFGNKDPRYFFHLSYLTTAAPSCKKICIYRPRLEFWNSWEARANNRKDAHWQRGQTGFFGVLELMCMLGAMADVASNGEVLIVNFDYLFFDEVDTIQMIYDYLGAEQDIAAPALFRESLFSPIGVLRGHSNEQALATYRYLQLGELERRMFTRPAVTNVEIADILTEYCRFSRTLTAALVDGRFPEMPMAELAYFLGADELRNALVQQGIITRAQQALDGDGELVDQLRGGLANLHGRFDSYIR